MNNAINKVHHCPWTDNNIADKSVQLIIADPPYFEVRGEFDFAWSSFEEYLEDVKHWAVECKRVLADNGTLLWYGSAKNIAYTQIIFDKQFDLINNLVWNKGSFMGLEESESIRSFAPCTERILMYSNETFNLTSCVSNIRDYIRAEILKSKGSIVFKHINEVLGTATNGGGVASATLSLEKTEPAMLTKELYEKLQAWCSPHLAKPYEQLRGEYEQLRRPFNNQFNLQEVLNFSNEQNKTGSKYDHPTVKPETLTRALILTCSRPGDLVLIPFAGSGTECAMCMNEGRNFIGFDIKQEYVEMANKRTYIIQQAPKLL